MPAPDRTEPLKAEPVQVTEARPAPGPELPAGVAAGNAAVRRLVTGGGRGEIPGEVGIGALDSAGSRALSGWLGASPPQVSRPADPLERQAEAVAAGSGQAAAGLAQAAPDAGPSLVPGSTGVPLPAVLRAPAETDLGADLSAVRVHDDAGAQTFARAVGAQAATVGSRVYFGAGRFAPESADGQHLLRHELVHTLQQRSGTALYRAPESDLRLAEIDSQLETRVITDEYRAKLEAERATLLGTGAAIGPGSKPERVAAFKQLVLTAAVQRLLANRQSLFSWSTLVEQSIPAADFAAMGLAQSGGLEPFLQAQDIKDPGLRELRLQQAMGHYRACTGCHVETSLWNTREERSRAGGPDWTAPSARAASPAGYQPRPGTVEARFHELLPDPGEAAARVERVRVILRALGSDGFRVLPASILGELESGTVTALRAQVRAAIEERQSGYAALSARVSSGEMGYENFAPIIRDLLPMADPEVSAAIEQEMTANNRWRLAEAIVVGILSIAALALTLFPPTSAVGLAALGGLEMGLGVYGGVRGAESMTLGSQLQQGLGANDVFDPSQQDAGGTMVVQGFINVVLAPLAVVGGALRAGRGLAGLGAPATALLPAGRPYVQGAFIVTYAEDGAIVATLRSNPQVIIILRGNTLTVYQSMGPAGMRVVTTMEGAAAWRAAGLPKALPPGSADAVPEAPVNGSPPLLLGPGTPATTPGTPPYNVLPTDAPAPGVAPAYSLPLGPEGAGGVMHMNRGLRPADFGLAYIAEDPTLLGMWNQATRESSLPGMNNGYTRYLAAIDNHTAARLTNEELNAAFNAVNKRFMAAARGAGYDIATVHHWNYPKDLYWQQIVDPRQLVPMPGQAELQGGYLQLHQGGIHPLTTGVPSNPTGGPVAPVHVKDLPIWQSTLVPE